MKSIQIIKRLFKYTLLVLIAVNICFSADSKSNGMFVGKKMDESLKEKHSQYDIKTPYSAPEMLGLTEKKMKEKEFPPLPLDAKILVLGARPDEVSVEKHRPFMLDNPSIYFF